MQNDILLKHLSTIVDPELGVDIVELGMVKDISFVESTVVIKLALTIAECPMRNQIETEIKRKLLLMENVNAVLFMNAMKSYSTTFDPFGLPFIPVGVPRLSFLRIRPAILRTRFRCRFTHVDFLNYGHCDILTPAWSNLMHYTRMAVGNRARTLKMFRSYHSAIADAWCDFIA